LAPLITTTVEETRQAVTAARSRGLTVALAPTMGALHAGHASLIRAARVDAGFVVVSIFVNPTQFGPNEDLSRYPRPFENDVKVCEAERVDLIFHPTPEIMYAPAFQTYAEVTQLQTVLCGASRPGHFRGVATVVLKLFNIVKPDTAYFGQKDAQQARLLMQMVRDLDVPVELKVCPIVREPDGLAMSSRNVYLDPTQRQNATVLFRTLQTLRQRIDAGAHETGPLAEEARRLIEATPGARIDYVSIVDFDRLQPIDPLRGRVLIAFAVFFGATRLIDNTLIEIA
jgi:pantoate--beta-alanine ligase